MTDNLADQLDAEADFWELQVRDPGAQRENGERAALLREAAALLRHQEKALREIERFGDKPWYESHVTAREAVSAPPEGEKG